MSKKRSCQCCGQIFSIIRNPKQHYCSQDHCQRTRRNQWRRNARHNDADYKSNQRSANQRWQASHSDYWKRYRASHQEYVQRNRDKQRVRDRGAKIERQAQTTHLAKSDAFPDKLPILSGNYWLIPKLDNLAKSDALFVRIDLVTTDGNRLESG